jgi:hypothetical protein
MGLQALLVRTASFRWLEDARRMRSSAVAAVIVAAACVHRDLEPRRMFLRVRMSASEPISAP